MYPLPHRLKDWVVMGLFGWVWVDEGEGFGWMREEGLGRFLWMGGIGI